MTKLLDIGKVTSIGSKYRSQVFRIQVFQAIMKELESNAGENFTFKMVQMH